MHPINWAIGTRSESNVILKNLVKPGWIPYISLCDSSHLWRVTNQRVECVGTIVNYM